MQSWDQWIFWEAFFGGLRSLATNLSMYMKSPKFFDMLILMSFMKIYSVIHPSNTLNLWLSLYFLSITHTKSIDQYLTRISEILPTRIEAIRWSRPTTNTMNEPKVPCSTYSPQADLHVFHSFCIYTEVHCGSPGLLDRTSIKHIGVCGKLSRLVVRIMPGRSAKTPHRSWAAMSDCALEREENHVRRLFRLWLKKNLQRPTTMATTTTTSAHLRLLANIRSIDQASSSDGGLEPTS